MTARAKATRHPVNVRFPAAVGEKLDRYATLVDSSKSAVVVRAVEEYLTWRVPQQRDLKRAIAAARKQKPIDNAEVIAWLEDFIAKHAR